MIKESTFVCDKIIRHKDPERMRAHGIIPRIHAIKPDTMILYLKNKILEEAQEIQSISCQEKMISEMTDIYDAILCIVRIFGFEEEDFLARARFKQQERGTYEHGICLDMVTVPVNHPEWSHYNNNPSKYPILL